VGHNELPPRNPALFRLTKQNMYTLCHNHGDNPIY
jgi:hypothetical protein